MLRMPGSSPARVPLVSDRTDRLLRGALGLRWSGVPEEDLRAAVDGRVVLVTGASSGIGEFTARQLAAAGATVLLVARRRSELDRVAAEIGAAGGTAAVLPADLTDEAAVTRLAAEILERWGPPDVVVNNAGRSIRRPLHHSYDRLHDYSRTIAINYLGPVSLLLGVLPAMRERGHGHVVNVGTVAVDLPAPYWSAYAASKSAFEAWLRSVSPELRLDGVASTSIHFGLVHTAMSAPTQIFTQAPGMTAEEAAAVVCKTIVERPRVLRPWWSALQSLGADVSPGTADITLTWLVRFDDLATSYYTWRRRRRSRSGRAAGLDQPR